MNQINRSIDLERPWQLLESMQPNDNLANQPISKNKLMHKIGGITLASVAALGLLVSSPIDPEYHDVSLVTELVLSDVKTAANEIIEAHPGSNNINSNNFISRFRLNNGLFKNSDLGWYASVWPSSMALEALYTTALLDNKQTYYADFNNSFKAINQNYWNNVVAGHSGYDQGIAAFHSAADPPLIDDNLWMGLVNMGAYQKTKDPQDLQRAESIFNLATSQWDRRKGGVFWMVQLENADNHIRAVVSNASVVSLGVELYFNNHQQYYLDKSEKIYHWLNKVLLDPVDGLYNDHITDFGYIDPIKYTYVQGIMIGAMLSLNQVNPTHYPLAKPIALAEKAMNYFVQNKSYGDPAFDAIWSQNLLRLASKYNDPSFTKKAKQSVAMAIQASPKSPRGLLYAAGDLELQNLSHLPFDKYSRLFR